MLHLDTGLGTHFGELGQVAKVAQEAEATGFGALWSAETKHDPFLPLTLVAEYTSRIRFGTAVAIAFPRSPMAFANIGWDLARFSGGRFMNLRPKRSLGAVWYGNWRPKLYQGVCYA
jgi:alkanesulfonate monooxygenase SsuD/methylene tetrahydromethanopterin reductase-like flavin-dependent oxidoreductase (luciferase family)